jgi:hypothetical protein
MHKVAGETIIPTVQHQKQQHIPPRQIQVLKDTPFPVTDFQGTTFQLSESIFKELETELATTDRYIYEYNEDDLLADIDSTTSIAESASEFDSQTSDLSDTSDGDLQTAEPIVMMRMCCPSKKISL